MAILGWFFFISLLKIRSPATQWNHHLNVFYFSVFPFCAIVLCTNKFPGGTGRSSKWSLSRSLTKLDVLGCVSCVQSNLFARLQCPTDGQTLHIELQLTGQQIADDHCWQQINGMARLPENLLSTVREDAGRHVIWVILFLYSHTKPENAKRWDVNEFDGTIKPCLSVLH